MSVQNLNKIFKPSRIALVGVGTNPNSVGGKTLSNLVGAGYTGVVYPVNPDYEAVLGIACFPSLDKLPRTPDLVIICTASGKVPGAIEECVANGIFGVIIMSAGFKEIGGEGIALENRIKEIQSQNPNLRILGPNCLGIIVPSLKLNASFASGLPKAGNVAFISQSGALCTSVLDWAIQEKIGFSYFISVGNSMDVDFGDLIDFVGEDPNTKSIILYVESISDARKFISASRAFARNKPILVYKAGRFPESAEVAASHTGALASEDAIYDAAFQRAGVSRVYDIGEIFDCAELLGRNKIPRGSRLGIVTNAGGPGVMASDKLIAAKGSLAKLSDETMEQLNMNLPEYWSHRNPVDVLGDARAKRFAKAVDITIRDKGVDAVLAILTPQGMTNPAATARELIKVSEKQHKPIIAAWLGGGSMKEGIELFSQAGIPAYRTPEQAIQAFMTLVAYSNNLEQLYETPREIPMSFSVNRDEIRKGFLETVPAESDFVSEEQSKTLLEKYGIPTSLPQQAKDKKEATAMATKMGYPVVMKIDSPDITHKSDVGGVILNLRSVSDVEQAFDSMMETVCQRKPKARIDGVTLQPMINLNDGVEVLLGSKKDPVFGSVLLAGMGGTQAELFGDRVIGLPPLNERLARSMVEQLKIYKLLKGYRGDSPKNVDKLIETINRLSYLIADFPEIKELDINPLLVTETDVIALDARIIMESEQQTADAKPYSHLAMQPYPEKYIKSVGKVNGTEVLLRPIKPEDEPLWLKMLGSCSKESIYSRFRYMFNWDSHDIATRYCYIDYSREIAIVAEIDTPEGKELIGVGRLIADPDHDTAEYAVLIADAWQHKDLGNCITEFCLEIAEDWNLKKFVAQTTSDNKPMISVFQKHGFDVEHGSDSSVEVEKVLN